MNRPLRNATLVTLCIGLLLGCSPQETTSHHPGRKIKNQDSDDATLIATSQPAAPKKREENGVAMPMPTAGHASMESAAHGMGTLSLMAMAPPPDITIPPPATAMNTESYTPTGENSFISTANDPLSTFSIDVDTASWANIRRFINQGSLPPSGAIRIEEMINYFSYDYPEPPQGPLAITTETGPCPWQPKHQLVRIGLQARRATDGPLPPANLVFLIDVSGSMNHPNKLPLVKKSLLLLVEQMTARDRIAIVTYAGAERVVLAPTPCSRKEEIRAAIETLSSGGATHASSGIETAYSLAEQGFMASGSNRVILASDGDFNVGITSRGELQRLIEAKRELGVFLTVLGFGMGNYHDDTMEILADTGNGNYAYIDSLLEAKKVLKKEVAGTLFTLAGDVKIQVEFNPSRVGGYRLLGYENRMLQDEDFKDDTKDAGEVGIGHTVTALYELIPAGADDVPDVDQRRYGTPGPQTGHQDELLTVKLRYKPEGSDTSTLLSHHVKGPTTTLATTSNDFRFAAAVAGFGMLLKDSSFKGDLTYPALIELARSSRGTDREGYRAEALRLMEAAELLEKQ